MAGPAPFQAGPRLQRLLEADRRYSARLRYAEKPGLLRRLAIWLAHSGDSWFWGAGLVAVWWFSGAGGKIWAVRLAVAIVLMAGIVFVIKRRFRRRRPAGD